MFNNILTKYNLLLMITFLSHLGMIIHIMKEESWLFIYAGILAYPVGIFNGLSHLLGM